MHIFMYEYLHTPEKHHCELGFLRTPFGLKRNVKTNIIFDKRSCSSPFHLLLNFFFLPWIVFHKHVDSHNGFSKPLFLKVGIDATLHLVHIYLWCHVKCFNKARWFLHQKKKKKGPSTMNLFLMKLYRQHRT